MGALSPTHWLIIIGVLVVLFGAKRLPDAARSLGRSARILKAEVKDMNPDTTTTTTGTDTDNPPGGPPAVLPPATSTTDEASASSASPTPTPSDPTTPSTASNAAAVGDRKV